jgi:hypothetical protein
LSSADWSTFNGKESALTFSSPLSRATNTISIPVATTSVNGYLSSTDWTTFNNKQAALNGTGFVKITGTTISYDNSTYLTSNQSITLSGAVTGSGSTAIVTTLANSIVGIANLSATGTPSASSYLRGDNTWATVAGSGTVTSVAALTLGTTGTDVSSSVANGTTTPVITLNIPTASAANRGVLSTTDWSAFSAKQGAITLTTTGTSGAATLVGDTLNIPQYSSGGGGGTVTIGASATDILSATSGEITADDAGSDKIVFWDDSANKLTYLTLGDGVEINDTTITAQDWLVIAASDENNNLIAGTNKVYFRMPYAGTLLAVRASVNTASTGSTIIVDINENGTSILSTKLSIDATEKSSTTAAVPAVISDSALADDSEISIDIDQIGSTIPGKGLKVYLKVRRT